jgi:hypothetical protein
MRGAYPRPIDLPYTTHQTRAGFPTATAPPTGTRPGRDHYRWTRWRETHVSVPISVHLRICAVDLHFTSSLSQHFTKQPIALFLIIHIKSPTYTVR